MQQVPKQQEPKRLVPKQQERQQEQQRQQQEQVLVSEQVQRLELALVQVLVLLVVWSKRPRATANREAINNVFFMNFPSNIIKKVFAMNNYR